MTKLQKQRAQRHRKALKALRDEIAAKNAQLQSARGDIEIAHAEFSRHHRALGGVMHDLARELADPMTSPTSIAAARLIAALHGASETIHARE